MKVDLDEAINRVDEMLRVRKDKMQIVDCLAISGVLKHVASLRAENERLKSALRTLEDEAFRIVDAEPKTFPHLERAVGLAQKVLKEIEG